MESPGIRLVVPSEEWRDEYCALAKECEADPELSSSGFGFRRPEDFADFRDLLRFLSNMAAGVNLKPGYAVMDTYWAIAGSRIVGVSRLRHDLEAHGGGHIGYMVRRSERRKGYGAAILMLTLERARALGLKRVLITCNSDNEGSIGVIRRNGGVEAEQHSPETRRFWIELG